MCSPHWDLYSGGVSVLCLVPDAKSFGLFDVEEGRFDLWFARLLVLSV